MGHLQRGPCGSLLKCHTSSLEGAHVPTPLCSRDVGLREKLTFFPASQQNARNQAADAVVDVSVK